MFCAQKKTDGQHNILILKKKKKKKKKKTFLIFRK
jgi:hypothetical protein